MTDDVRNIIFDRYKLTRKLGKGSFGKIYGGVDLQTGREVAVKFEMKKTPEQKQLAWEYQLYKKLAGSELFGGGTWPRVHQLGQRKCGSLIMVMDLLGKSLDALCRPVHPSGLAYIALHAITSLRVFHKRGFVHRDIKLGNLLLTGKDTFPHIVLIDYGLSSKVKTAEQYADGRGLKGTVRYTSVNTHLGVEQNVRDDLQSLGYVLLHLAGVDLPWSNVRKSSDKRRAYYQILKAKLSFDVWRATRPIAEPIRGPLVEYVLYVNSLSFHMWPDYDYLLSLFQEVAASFDGRFPMINSQSGPAK